MEKVMPDLGLDEFKVVDYEENKYILDMVVVPTIKRSQIKCPECYSSIIEIKKETKRYFKDLNVCHKRVGVYALADHSLDRNSKNQ